MRWNLAASDWLKIIKGAVLASIAAGLTYLAEHLTEIDFGSLSPWIAAVLSVLLNYLRKVIEG